MQLPITIALHRSFLGVTGLILVHVLAVLVLVLPPWQAWATGVGFVGIASSLIISWRLGIPKIEALRILKDGRLECRLLGAEDFIAAEIQTGATVHPWLTVVRLKAAGNTFAVPVFPGSASPDDLRRLRMWLRWRGDFSAAKEGA